MMDQLGIKALRPGPSGNESAPNHANYDESLANPFPNLPDVLTLKNGKKVTTPKQWWEKRRPEIVEDFEREVIGRVPKNVPKVTWTVTEKADGVLGGMPVTGRVVRPRRQLGVSRHHRRHPADRRHADGREDAGAGDDDVQLGAPAAGRRRGADAAIRPAASSGRRPAGHRAAHRRRLGLRVPQPDQHPGRQRRRPDEGHHRPRQQGPAAQARRLGRAARLGVGRQPRPRLLRDRPGGRREAGRHRRRLALRQGRARDDGLRPALRDGARRLVRRGRREAAPPQLRRGGREPHRHRRVPLDGRQLPEVRRGRGDLRQQERRRPAGGRARADRAVRAAADVHQLRRPREGRREVARSAGQLHGDRRGAAGVPAARREGPRRRRRLHEREDAAGERRPARRPARLAPARRRPHRRPELEVLHRRGPTSSSATRRRRSHGRRDGARAGRSARAAHRCQFDDRARSSCSRRRSRAASTSTSSATRSRAAGARPTIRSCSRTGTQNFYGWNAGDFGWGADRIENILWRLENGELDGVNPKVIVVLAGTNNVGAHAGRRRQGRRHHARPDARSCSACRDKAPNATIVLTAIFPRNDNMAVMPEIVAINGNLAALADGKTTSGS